MFVLSLVLVVIYIIFFTLHEESLSSPILWFWSTPVVDAAQDKVIAPIQIAKSTPQPASSATNSTGTMFTQTVPWSSRTPATRPQPVERDPNTPSFIVSTQQLFLPPSERAVIETTSAQIAPAQILYLADTHHRVGVMKSAKFVGIDSSVQYILKNNDNTHFAYLGKELPEIADSFAAIWWKSVAFTQKNDIHTHWLFGDKVIFLLVPQYIGIKQLFFVYFAEAGDRWFIQVDNDIFETTKPLLRELFAKRYNR
jgi:hypothetical protein